MFLPLSGEPTEMVGLGLLLLLTNDLNGTPQRERQKAEERAARLEEVRLALLLVGFALFGFAYDPKPIELSPVHVNATAGAPDQECGREQQQQQQQQQRWRG